MNVNTRRQREGFACTHPASRCRWKTGRPDRQTVSQVPFGSSGETSEANFNPEPCRLLKNEYVVYHFSSFVSALSTHELCTPLPCILKVTIEVPHPFSLEAGGRAVGHIVCQRLRGFFLKILTRQSVAGHSLSPRLEKNNTPERCNSGTGLALGFP